MSTKDHKPKKIKKIIVKTEDELIDIVRKINEVDSDRILLTFADKSDLLISPISFKVLQKAADELDKLLIAQIVQNKAGLTNAQFARVTATSSPSEIPSDLWKIAKQDFEFRQKEKEQKLKRVDKLPEEELEKSVGKDSSNNSDPLDNISLDDFDKSPDNQNNSDDTESPVQIKSEDELPELTDDSSQDDSDIEPTENESADIAKPKTLETQEEENISDFQKRIAQTLQKAQKDYTDPQNKIVREDDFILALDQDIQNVPGVDLNKFDQQHDKNDANLAEESLESFDKSDEKGESDDQPKPGKSSNEKQNEKDSSSKKDSFSKIDTRENSTSKATKKPASEKKQKAENKSQLDDFDIEFYEDDIDQFDKSEGPVKKENSIKKGSPDFVPKPDNKPAKPNEAIKAVGNFFKSVAEKIPKIPETSPETRQKPQKKSSDLVGKDFRDSPAPKPSKLPSTPSRLPSNFQAGVQPAQNKSAAIESVKSVLQRLLLKSKDLKIKKLILPTVFIILLIFYGIYKITSQATVNVSIESRPVKFERTFTGKEGSEFSLSESKVAVKKEEAIRERSETGDASGTGYEGEPSSGTIKVQCLISVDEYPDNVITIPKGTTATEISTGKKYVTLSAINDKQCPSLTTIDVEAKGVGPDYNLESGSGVFAFDGFDRNKVSAVNVSAIDGGTQEEVPEITQNDVDELIEELEEIVEEEAQTELEEINAVDGWRVIQDTIEHDTEGEPKPDPAVGTKSETFDISLSVKSSALYYRRSDLENSLLDLLLQEARKQNVFGNTTELEAVGEIDAKYDVVVQDEEVSVTVEVSGMVKPAITEEEILSNLSGKSWSEGMIYLGNLPFLAGPVDVDFKPAWFPKFLKHFPDGKNQIFVHISEVSFEDSVSEDNEGTTSDGDDDSADVDSEESED